MDQSHRYQFFLKANEAWDAVYAACASATTSISFEHFILRDDAAGGRFIELFKRKAKEGVRVRLLLDAIGSAELFQAHLNDEFKEAGVELIFFNSIIPLTWSHYTPWFFRDHRKLIVVDSKQAITGGVCFQEHMTDWRDTVVVIEGPVVTDMERSFDYMWTYAEKRGTLPRVREFLDEARRFLFLPSMPWRRRRTLYYELVERIEKATRRIWLSTPYFVPDRRLFHALRRAAKRGVAVTLLLPERSDNMLVDLGTRSNFERTLAAGIRILLYQPHVLHAKTGVIDDWATIGSLNLDHASLQYNFEGNLVSTEPGFVAALASHFKNDLKRSNALTAATWKQRHLSDRFLEWLVRPIRFVL